MAASGDIPGNVGIHPQRQLSHGRDQSVTVKLRAPSHGSEFERLTFIRQIQEFQTEAVKGAATIVALEKRLTSIESLARHALEAKPRDLEETWMRIKQLAEK